MAERKRAILYARSATGEGAALARQLETCRAWADANGYTVTGEYSEVASGLAPTLPKQAQAVTRAESGSAALICVDAIRLSRDFYRLARIMVDCERRSVIVIFVKE